MVRLPVLCLLAALPSGLAAADLRSVPAFFAPEQNGFVSYGSRVPVVAGKGKLTLAGIDVNHLHGALHTPEPTLDGGAYRAYTAGHTAEGTIASSVLYRDVYPGIDLRLSFESNTFKSDYLVRPGADAGQIWLRFEDAKSAITRSGDLRVEGNNGREFTLPKPYAYQEIDGERRSILGSFRKDKAGNIGFQLGSYNRTLPLVIDPYVVTSALLTGGSGEDKVFALGVDSSGNTVLAGSTESSNFTPLGAAQGADAFVVKLNSANQIVWATYLRGTSYDAASALVLDTSGNVYVTGYSTSADFVVLPLNGSYPSGGRDAFFAKVDPTGALVFNYLFGGSGAEEGNAIAISPSGDIWIAGDTSSENLPRGSAYQSTLAGGVDAFIARYSSSGFRISSTFLGGAGDDIATGIAVDTNGVYVTGSTTSTNFPTASAAYSTNGGFQDAFVTKFNSTATALVYSTFLGGAEGRPGQVETGTAIAVDGSGNAYVTGITGSANFPLVNALQGYGGGSTDIFLSKFASAGALTFSTYLGGAGSDEASAVRLQTDGSIYVAGNTSSSDLVATDAVQSALASSGKHDGLLIRIASGLTQTLMQTYLGGTDADAITAMVLSGTNIYLAGFSSSPSLLSLTTTKGTIDGFIIRLQERPVSLLYSTNASGTQFAVSGAGCSAGTYTDFANLSWTVNSICTLSIASPQTTSAGVRRTFTTWGDGNTVNPRSWLAVPGLPNATMQFATSYLLTRNVVGSGTIGVNVATPDGYFASGTQVQLAATSGPGYQFLGWSGDVTGTSNPVNLSMAAPRSATATFGCTYQLSAPTISVSDAATSAAVTITSGAGCNYTATSNASWIVVSSGGSGTTTGTVTLAIAQNTSTSGRTGSVTIGGVNLSVTQGAIPQYATTIIMSISGIQFTVSGANCGSGTYTSSATLSWPRGTSCTIGFSAQQALGNVGYYFLSWQDNSGANPRTYVANSPATYTVNFGTVPDYPVNIATAPTGLPVTIGGTNCSPGTYVSPAQITWRNGSQCTVSLAATQALGSVPFRFVGWQDGSVANPRTFSVTGAAAYTVYYAPPDYSVNLNTSPPGLTYSVSGANCFAGTYTGAVTVLWQHGATCSVTLAQSQTLGGVPYTLVGWTDGSPANPRTFLASGPGSYTASFALPDYNARLSFPAGALFTVSGTNCSPGSYTTQANLVWKHGSSCTVTVASPQTIGAVPYNFSGWVDGSSANPRVFTVAGSVDLAGTLAVPQYAQTISMSVSGTQFSVSGSNCSPGTYTSGAGLTWRHGTTCSINVPTPQGQYIFTGWQDGSTANPRQITATGAAYYTAIFGLQTYPVTLNSSPQGFAITVSGTGCSPGTYNAPAAFNAQHGASCLLAPSASQTLGGNLYNFSGWSDGSTANPRTLSVNGPATMSAVYTLATFPVQLTASPAGAKVTVSGAGCAPGVYTTPATISWLQNSTCTLSVAANESVDGKSYIFEAWADGVTASQRTVTASGALTFSAIYQAYTPDVKTLSPIVGGGIEGTYRAVFTHNGGASKHYLGYILFLPTPNIVWYTAKGSCLVEYNRISNGVRLINDPGDNWLGPLEGIPARAGATVLTNSQCSVDPAKLRATFSGNDMEINLSVAFKNTYAGVLATFLQEQDVEGNWTGMTQFGNWVVAPLATPRPGPYIVSGGPSSGAGTSTTIAMTTGHTSGIGGNGFLTILISDRIVGGNACQLLFFPFENTVNLVSDTNQLAAPVSPHVGDPVTLSNSKCSLNVAGMTRTNSGGNVTTTYPMTFNRANFGGTKNVYGNAFDIGGSLTHWVQFGIWTVQ